MAITDRGQPATGTKDRSAVLAYLAVLLAVILIVAGGATIWLSTDVSSTNVLASDPQAISTPAPVKAN